ncbi:MAG: DUF86 domain-containing protein [Anaerolineae bacterium]|nr:DUF86 domain-containing protein [Anaerolineae bacterium]
MSKRRDADYLNDVREAMERIAIYTSGLTYDQFMADTKTQDAIVRNLEVIGEATKKLSSSLRDSYPQIPWKNLAGVRDKLIHDYFGVNYEIVWTIAQKELPTLLSQIESLAQDNSPEV